MQYFTPVVQTDLEHYFSTYSIYINKYYIWHLNLEIIFNRTQHSNEYYDNIREYNDDKYKITCSKKS